jgi:hypothetical protein
MKITKNKSMFDTLVPINKSIKPSQIHEDLKTKDSKALNSLGYNLSLAEENHETFHFLPAIHSPLSTQSTSRAGNKKEPLRFSYAGSDFSSEVFSKNVSPLNIRDKINSDIKRIMQGFQKQNFGMSNEGISKKRCKGLKRNKSKY